MPRPFEGLAENLRILRDDKACADLDRRIAERLTRGEGTPLEPIELPPEVDRSSLEWLWAEPFADGAAPSEKLPATIPLRRRPDLRIVTWLGGAAVAASVMFVAGLLIGRGGGDGLVPLAAAVTLTKDAVRGPGSIGSLRVENRSSGRAFVTAVGLVPGRPPALHYREKQQFIEVAPGSVLTIGNLPASFDGARAVLVVLSPTPIGEAVRRVAGDLAGLDPEAAPLRLRAGLSALGYRGFAIEMATLAAD